MCWSRGPGGQTAVPLIPLDADLLMPLNSPNPCCNEELLVVESPGRRLLGQELELVSGSLKRRVPKMLKEDSESSTDSITGNLAPDGADIQLGVPKASVQRDNSRCLVSMSDQTAQPDLMLTSQSLLKSSPSLLSSGSQIVCDGVLEKSYSTAPPNLSTGNTRLPKIRLGADPETHLLIQKDKSQKSVKIKNLFKKKNESVAEKAQSRV